MEMILYFLIFIVSSFMSVLILTVVNKQNNMILGRLNEIRLISKEEANGDLHEPFWDRIIKPSYQRIIEIIGSLTPKRIKEKYSKLIMTSGESKKMTFNSVVLTQFLLAIIASGLTFIIGKYTDLNINNRTIIISFLVGFIVPIFSLSSNATKRKEKIRRELPDLLDLIYISVEAGLGFDLAMKRSTDKMKGILSEEIKKTLNEISRGRDRIEALRGLEKRTDVVELTSFITAIIQTEQLGSNIANMLKIQSISMRQKRRQHAEEKAAKMGIKMLFPLILFIFPALFVVILGPALINIYENFIKMSW